jgi:hypothetical protein
MCELVLGLPEVTVLAVLAVLATVERAGPDRPLAHVHSRALDA